jgi:hypothetical protein
MGIEVTGKLHMIVGGLERSIARPVRPEILARVAIAPPLMPNKSERARRDVAANRLDAA